MLKFKLKSKIKNKKNKNRRRPARVLIVVLLTATLIMIGVAVFFNQHEASVGVNQSVSNNYKSLNLAVAKSASYSNSAIQISQDNGVANQVKHLVVRFNVPKDNLKEFAYMTLPAGAPPNSVLPVIILCHGYTVPASYSTTRAYLSDMEFYSRQGYVVIKPDFRGQGLSRTQGLPEGAYFSMAYNTDLISLIAAVKQTPYLKTDNLSLWGHSMGAYIALRAAVLAPEVKNLILLSLPGDIVENARNSVFAVSDRSNFVASKIRTQQIRLYGDPLSNLNYWNQTAPTSLLKSLNARVQVHFGSADTLVPLAYSNALVSDLIKLHKPNQLFIYPGGGHGLVPERTLIWPRSVQQLKSGG